MSDPLFTTLDGLKRLAVKLKRENDMKHTHALEVVARAGGFRTYAAAKVALAKVQS